jgi:hypothetical protein
MVREMAELKAVIMVTRQSVMTSAENDQVRPRK